MTDSSNPGGSAEVRPDIILKDLPVLGDDRPALNTIEGVESVVRAFGTRLVGYRRKYLETGKAEAPEAFVEAEAKAMTDIFYGRNPDYATTPWNSPDQMGYGFGDSVGIAGEPEEAMQAYWSRLAGDMFDLMVKHENGMDDEQAQFALDVMIEESVYAILRLPLSAD
jgi:hypothetical protein